MRFVCARDPGKAAGRHEQRGPRQTSLWPDGTNGPAGRHGPRPPVCHRTGELVGRQERSRLMRGLWKPGALQRENIKLSESREADMRTHFLLINMLLATV